LARLRQTRGCEEKTCPERSRRAKIRDGARPEFEDRRSETATLMKIHKGQNELQSGHAHNRRDTSTFRQFPKCRNEDYGSFDDATTVWISFSQGELKGSGVFSRSGAGSDLFLSKQYDKVGPPLVSFLDPTPSGPPIARSAPSNQCSPRSLSPLRILKKSKYPH
jgi:hypothetical protein